MSIQMQLVEYAAGGRLMEGYMAWDDALPDARPGVMIAHAWAGRGRLECKKARDLASLGYVGFALDLYGKGVLGSRPEENAGLMQPFLDDRAMLQSRMTQALELLRAQKPVDASRTAAMGFCFGGLCVLDLARTGADLQGVVSFHGLFNPAPNISGRKSRAKVLALHGWDDPMATPDQTVSLGRELTAAEADWQIHAYGRTAHAFTNPAAKNPAAGTVYSPGADRRSWQALRNFLAEVLA